MTKKLFTKLSLAVVLVVVMACSVFAADITVYADATTPAGQKTATVTYEGAEVVWRSDNASIATVTDAGVITAVAPGSTIVRAYDKETTMTMLAAKTVEVKNRTLVGIEVTGNPTSLTYVTGEYFDPAGIVVEATYDNGDKINLTAADIDYSPKAQLNAGNEIIDIYYTAGGVTKSSTVTINVADVQKLEITGNLKSYYNQGDILNSLEVTITYSNGETKAITSGFDILINGNVVSSDYKLSTTDATVAVQIGGFKSANKAITVRSQAATLNVIPLSVYRTYKVGEKFDLTGITVFISNYNGSTEQKTLTDAEKAKVTLSPAVFTTAHIGTNTTVTFTATYTDTYGTYTTTFKVDKLTVNDKKTDETPRNISGIDLIQEEYPIGYTFSKSDIYRIACRFLSGGTTEYIYKTKPTGTAYANYRELDDFTAEMWIEVLDKDGELKRSDFNTIEEEDVYKDNRGDDIVNLRFYFGRAVYYDFEWEVGDYGVSFYYDGELISVYKDITEALTATVRQDENVIDKFLLTSVSDRRAITLKLGDDAAISSRTLRFSPTHNIIIDLNGHDLEFYSSTIYLTSSNRYYVEITNSSSTDSEYEYADDDVSVILEKGDSLMYEYGEDDPVNAIKFEVDCGRNGEVEADPELDDYDEVSVAKGSKIIFTITPDDGYEIDTVKFEDTDVTSLSSYKVDKDGVATLTFTNVAAGGELEVTFAKKGTGASSAWNNPFTDVSQSSTYYTAVKFVYENGLFKGTTTTKFSPNTTMTRAMFATAVARLAKADLTPSRFSQRKFPDVTFSTSGLNEEMVRSIAWAAENGIILGYEDGTFGPNNKITHQQMYLMMQRYASFVANLNTEAKSTTITASDRSEIADWALDAVRYAQKMDFLVLRSGRIDPTGDALRWELATLLEDFCNNVLNNDR